MSPELDIASQGATPQEALANLKEAVGLFLECASPAELEAIYANFAVITHTPSEVLVDFARILPGAPKSTDSAP